MKTVAVFVIGVSLMWTSATQAEEFRVNRAAFAASIQNREPSPTIDRRQPIAPGPLWFWSEIRADQTTLKALLERQALPLEHRWYKNAPGGNPLPDQAPDFSRSLEEIDKDKIDALAREARQRTFYTYRTTSCRVAIPPGNWTVKVTDAFGNSLPCADGSPCRFNIRIAQNARAIGATPCPLKQ